MDENRDYGGNKGQGGTTAETVSDELKDMADLIKRDRSHPSVVLWSFCNEVGCNNESAAEAFREVSKLWDNTRPVTQNHHGTALSTDFLDVQGFSHKHTKDFEGFHHLYPKKPMVATECCSCACILAALARTNPVWISQHPKIRVDLFCVRWHSSTPGFTCRVVPPLYARLCSRLLLCPSALVHATAFCAVG